MLTKDEAIYNLSKAYLERLVANRLYFDNAPSIEADRDYYIKAERYDTMRRAYIECDIVTYTETREAIEDKYKLTKAEPSETE
tara:strand:- start:184 stop:432 length:249 start_codon:yes stop_codon:yes gene_type:complete